jgi:hypothetical protein
VRTLRRIWQRWWPWAVISAQQERIQVLEIELHAARRQVIDYLAGCAVLQDELDESRLS